LALPELRVLAAGLQLKHKENRLLLLEAHAPQR